MSLSLLLQQAFPFASDKAEPREITERVYSGTFSLNDPKACGSCHTPDICNHETLRIKSDSEVHIIDFEDHIRNSKKGNATSEGGVCDYLLYSEGITQIALCDLTCSSGKYVEANEGVYPEGKRMKAFSQMQNSLIRILDTDSLLEIRLLSASRKRLLFGWREPEVAPADKAEQAMVGFGMTPASEETVLASLQYKAGHEFEFIQVKYPQPYLWDFEIGL